VSTLSVIIPNYNRAGLIGETLENILRQTRAPDELIVVDDGSTDDSVAEIARFGDRVRLIQQANAGPGAARNRGLAAATGEFIQFFDSDDLCSLNKLEIQVATLERTGADLVYGPWVQARLAEGRAHVAELPLQQRALPDGRSPLSWFLRGWIIVFQCCMVRRSLLDRVGPYRTDLIVGEDGELLFRMLLAGARIVHAPEALVLYRLHFGAQLSRGGIADTRRAADWLRHAEIIEAALEEAAGAAAPGDLARWRQVTRDARVELRRAGGVRLLDLPFRARVLLRRWQSGLRRRVHGSSQPRPFQPGPLDESQRALIRAIGYEPVLGGAAGA